MIQTLQKSIPRENSHVAKTEVLKTLAYFDIFKYPLKKSEIRQFLCNPIEEATLAMVLEELVANKTIFQFHHFYCLHNDESFASRRIHGNLRAAMLLPTAQRIGRFLSRFPYVKGIGISGSLSKNFADEKADIDFFIITKSNRLWIARTTMHLFKKLSYISGRQHFYCMNYYIDEQALKLDDHNIFTATEIKTLLPAAGKKAMEDFFTSNQWANEYLPLCDFRIQEKPDPGKSWLTKIIEWSLSSKPGDVIDNYLMRVTTKRWKQKEQKGLRNKKGDKMGLITGKHFARSNPGGFQEEVLRQYEERLKKHCHTSA